MTEIKLKEYLKTWMTDYEKHRDIIKKDIIDIKNHNDYDLMIQYKNKEKYILTVPTLKNAKSLRFRLKKKDQITLIAINSKENIDFLIDNWKFFIDLPELTIIFINPFSETDSRWIIKPSIHNMITENESLKIGIKSISSTVNYTTEKEFLSKIS